MLEINGKCILTEESLNFFGAVALNVGGMTGRRRWVGHRQPNGVVLGEKSVKAGRQQAVLVDGAVGVRSQLVGPGLSGAVREATVQPRRDLVELLPRVVWGVAGLSVVAGP